MASRGFKIDFNTKHLKTGDALPPHKGKLRIYNMRFCPFGQRTILALNLKQIDYEVINVNLIDKPEWLFVKSPLGKVPVIEVKEGETICDSLITVEYLDEVFPQRPLLPKDPAKKAFSKVTVEIVTSYVHPLYFKLINAKVIPEENTKAFCKGVKVLQTALQSKGTPFLNGDEAGFADFMIWPWFEKITTYDEKMIDGQKYPLLNAYFKRMQQEPAVSQYAIPRDILLRYIKSHSTGKPDYDIFHKNKF